MTNSQSRAFCILLIEAVSPETQVAAKCLLAYFKNKQHTCKLEKLLLLKEALILLKRRVDIFDTATYILYSFI